MSTGQKDEKGWQSEGESLNTGSASTQNDGQQQQATHNKEGIHNNALFAASMGRPATAAVNPHDNSGLSQTGTNPGYEGAVGEGAGGSMGTGFTSGQAGTTPTIATDSDYDQAGIGSTGSEDKSRQKADDAADESGE